MELALDVWMRAFMVGDGSGRLVLELEIVICPFGVEMKFGSTHNKNHWGL